MKKLIIGLSLMLLLSLGCYIQDAKENKCYSAIESTVLYEILDKEESSVQSYHLHGYERGQSDESYMHHWHDIVDGIHITYITRPCLHDEEPMITW